MIKSFKEAKSIYESRMAHNLEGQEKVEFPVVGEKYAIKYGDIVGPIVDASYVDGLVSSTPGTYGREFFDRTELKVGDDISSLWTVVEYTGDNQFIDLITGKTFGLPIEANSVLSTVRQDTEAQAKEIKHGLLEVPLSIRCSKVLNLVYGEGCGPDTELYYQPVSGLLPVLYELSDDVKASIMLQTMPIKDNISQELADLEKQSRDNIEDYYTKINNEQMDNLYNGAMQKSIEMHEEEVRAERERINEEFRMRKEAEEKQRLEKFKRAREDFDDLFGVIDVKSKNNCERRK